MAPISAPAYWQQTTAIFLVWISAATALLILLLLLEKFLRGRIVRRNQALEKIWRPHVLEWMATGEPQPLPGGRTMEEEDRRAIRRLLLRMAGELEGEPLKRLGDFYDWIGGTEGDLRMLRSRRWGGRAEACRRLGLFLRVQARERLLPLLKDRRVEVRYQAAWALARIATPEILPRLFAAMAGFSRYLNLHVGNLVRRLGAAAMGPLQEMAQTGDGRQKAVAARLLGEIGDRRAAEVLRALLREKDPEARVAACQALGRLGDPSSVDALRRAMSDPEWPVRMRSAEALGFLGDRAAIPELLKGMEDRQWWVRRHSAEALSRMGRAGEAALEEALDSPDRFSRDAAVEFLDRVGRIRQEANRLAEEAGVSRNASRFLRKILRCGAVRVLKELAQEHPQAEVRNGLREILEEAAA